MWNENPRIRDETDPISRNVPGQSKDLRPERTVGCVGGIGEGGRKRVTIVRQNRMIGSYEISVS